MRASQPHRPDQPIGRRQADLTEPPLSYAQEQLWFIDGFHDGFPAHNVAILIWLRGPLDQAALGRALDAVVARHEPLRTRLAAGPDGRPVQLIDPPGPAGLDRDDLSWLDREAAAARLRELAEADAMRPFDLAKDWPLRARLVLVTADEHALVIVAHQTAFDDRSLAVLQRDLAALYAADLGTTEGEPDASEPSASTSSATRDASLAELLVQFADFAGWERRRLTGPVRADLEAHWREALAGAATSQFPTDRPRPLLANHDGAVESIVIGTDIHNGLHALVAHEDTTLPVVLLAALQVLVHRYTGQSDVVIGALRADRSPDRPELTDLIGFLANALPIRTDLSGDPAFTRLLGRARAAEAAASAHQGLPFARIVEALNLERDPGRFPVFQVALGYAELPAEITSAGVSFRCEPVELAASRYDLSLAVRPEQGGLVIQASYPPALFDAETVRRLLGNYQVLLRGIVTDPAARLSQLPLLTDAELHDELMTWNDTARPFPVTCIHAGFEYQAARAPEAIAAQFEDQRISYAELNSRANQLARRLRCAGVGPEVLVGVCMTTGIARLTALLAVWKAGGGYVPLDPALPADRLAFMITDTGMRVVLADDSSAAAVPDGDALVLSPDALWPEIGELASLDQHSANLDDTGVTPSNVAYVIYTSGSTGQPKGVVVEHRQALNFLQGMIGAWHIGPASAVLGFAAFTFDVSVMDMFMPLLAGATVVLAPAQTLHSPPRLAELIRRSKVTFACLPPAVLHLLIGQDFPELHTLLSAGEELSSDLLRAWLRPGLEIYNGYGPTEASIGSTFMRLEVTTPLPPPIGRPKPNYQAYVLDEHLNPVPVGVTGELHVGGAGVARGYLNRPELTEQRFIADPFSADGRLYKTGDLVRRRPDGTIVFAGRIDNQVKIRGLRVELGEIEAALLAHPAVAQAIVTMITDGSGERQLAGYYRIAVSTAAKAGANGSGASDRDNVGPAAGTSPADLRAYLAETLPGYMIPTCLTAVEAFPLTMNGKIDKAALPAPAPVNASALAVAPRTLIETVLVNLFATVLGTEQVGATDSFFDAGGNSLQAMRLITGLRAALDVDLDVASVFLTPTPRQLAVVLRDQHGFDDEELGPDGIAGIAGLTDDQADGA